MPNRSPPVRSRRPVRELVPSAVLGCHPVPRAVTGVLGSPVYLQTEHRRARIDIPRAFRPQPSCALAHSRLEPLSAPLPSLHFNNSFRFASPPLPVFPTNTNHAKKFTSSSSVNEWWWVRVREWWSRQCLYAKNSLNTAWYAISGRVPIGKMCKALCRTMPCRREWGMGGMCQKTEGGSHARRIRQTTTNQLAVGFADTLYPLLISHEAPCRNNAQQVALFHPRKSENVCDGTGQPGRERVSGGERFVGATERNTPDKREHVLVLRLLSRGCNSIMRAVAQALHWHRRCEAATSAVRTPRRKKTLPPASQPNLVVEVDNLLQFASLDALEAEYDTTVDDHGQRERPVRLCGYGVVG